MTGRAFLATEHSLATAERAVLDAAHALARAQAEVEGALDAWMALPTLPLCGAEYDRLNAVRQARNTAADHLYDIASRELSAGLAGHDVPGFLRQRVNGGGR